METYFSEKRFFEWHKDQKSVTLRNKGASYGGGSEVLVCSPYQRNGKVGSLCATDYKWVQQEQVMQGKLIVCRKKS